MAVETTPSCQGSWQSSGKFKIKESILEGFGIYPNSELESSPTDLWVGSWSRLWLWACVCRGQFFLASLNLLPELHLHSTFSSASAPVSFVVRIGESNDLEQEALNIHQAWCNFSLFLKRSSFQPLGLRHPGTRAFRYTVGRRGSVLQVVWRGHCGAGGARKSNQNMQWIGRSVGN